MNYWRERRFILTLAGSGLNRNVMY